MAIVYKGRRGRRWRKEDHPRNPHTGEFVEKTGAHAGWLMRLAERTKGPNIGGGFIKSSGSLRPTGGKVSATSLKQGDHAKVAGVDQYGKSTSLNGYVRGPAQPVTMRQRGKRTPMFAIGVSETPSGAGGWHGTVYVPRDASVERTRPAADVARLEGVRPTPTANLAKLEQRERELAGKLGMARDRRRSAKGGNIASEQESKLRRQLSEVRRQISSAKAGTVAEPRRQPTLQDMSDEELGRAIADQTAIMSGLSVTNPRFDEQQKIAQALRAERLRRHPELAAQLNARMEAQAAERAAAKAQPDLINIMRDAGISDPPAEIGGQQTLSRANSRLRRGDDPRDIARDLRDSARNYKSDLENLGEDKADSREANGIRMTARILHEVADRLDAIDNQSGAQGKPTVDTPRVKRDDGGMAPTTELENIGPSYAYERRAELVGRTVTVHKPGRNGGKSTPIKGEVERIERLPGAGGERIYLKGRKNPIPLEAGIDLHPEKVAPIPSPSFPSGRSRLTLAEMPRHVRPAFAAARKRDYAGAADHAAAMPRGDFEALPKELQTELLGALVAASSGGHPLAAGAADRLTGTTIERVGTRVAPSMSRDSNAIAALMRPKTRTPAEIADRIRKLGSRQEVANAIDRMSMADLRDLAKEMGVKPKRGKSDTIDVITLAAVSTPSSDLRRDQFNPVTPSRSNVVERLAGVTRADASTNEVAAKAAFTPTGDTAAAAARTANALQAVSDSGAADRLLDGLTLAELRNVAKELKMPLQSGLTKPELRHQLVRFSGGARRGIDAMLADEGLPIPNVARQAAERMARGSEVSETEVDSLARLKRATLLATARQHGLKSGVDYKRGAPDREVAEAIVRKRKQEIANAKADTAAIMGTDMSVRAGLERATNDITINGVTEATIEDVEAGIEIRQRRLERLRMQRANARGNTRERENIAGFITEAETELADMRLRLAEMKKDVAPAPSTPAGMSPLRLDTQISAAERLIAQTRRALEIEQSRRGTGGITTDREIGLQAQLIATERKLREMQAEKAKRVGASPVAAPDAPAKPTSPWVRDDRNHVAAGTFRRTVEVDGKQYRISHMGVGYSMFVEDQNGNQLGMANWEDWNGVARIARNAERAARAAAPRPESNSDIFRRHSQLTRAQFDALPQAERDRILAELRVVRDSKEQESYTTPSNRTQYGTTIRGLRDAAHVRGAQEKIRELTYVAPPPVDNSIEGRAARLRAGDLSVLSIGRFGPTLDELDQIARAAGLQAPGRSWKKPKAEKFIRDQVVMGDRRPKSTNPTQMAEALRGADQRQALAILDYVEAGTGLTKADMVAIFRELGVRSSGKDKRDMMHALAVAAKGAPGKAEAASDAAPAVVDTNAAAITAKEAELEAARQRLQAIADRPIGGSSKRKSFAVRYDANLRRAGEVGREIERLERELKALRNPPKPAPPPATAEDIAGLEPDDLIKMKNGLVYRVVKVNKATVKVKVPPGMDDRVDKSKIVRVQKASVTAPKA